MGSKVKSVATTIAKPATIGGIVGGIPGAIGGAIGGKVLGGMGDKARSDYESSLSQYNSPKPDMTSAAWMDVAKQQLDTEQQRALQDMQNQSQSQLAEARTQLASRGGLRSGAAERLASSQMNQQGINRQNIGGQFGLQRAQLATEGKKFDQEMAIKEYLGDKAGQAQLVSARGKGDRGGVVGGVGRVFGK